MSEFDVVRIAYRHDRQVLSVNLDECQVGVGICSNDPGRIICTVVEGHGDIRGAVDDMIIGDDVTVGADDHARAGGLLIGLLHGLTIAVSEEASEKIAPELSTKRILIGHFPTYDVFGFYIYFNMYDRWYGCFGSLLEIYRLDCRRSIIGSLEDGGMSRVHDAVVGLTFIHHGMNFPICEQNSTRDDCTYTENGCFTFHFHGLIALEFCMTYAMITGVWVIRLGPGVNLILKPIFGWKPR